MSNYFVCETAKNHKAVTSWLNSLIGKDVSFLEPYSTGHLLPPLNEQVVRITYWYVVPRVDGAFVAFAQVETSPVEEA